MSAVAGGHPLYGKSPFKVALLETGTQHELLIAASAVVHIVATLIVLRLSKNSWVTARLRTKETPKMAACLFAAYVVGFVHATIVSVASVLVVVYERYEIWPVTIAFSIGYFISDFIFYALPTRQLVMVIHHVVMIVGHYPTMEMPAAVLYGAGDAHMIIWLSATGYLTEISNLFLDVRWFQLKVFGNPSQLSYAINSFFLLATYVVTRVLVMPLVRAHGRTPYSVSVCAPRLPHRRLAPGGHWRVRAGDLLLHAAQVPAVQAGGAARLLLRHRARLLLHFAHVNGLHVHPAQARAARLLLLLEAEEARLSAASRLLSTGKRRTGKAPEASGVGTFWARQARTW